MVEVMLFHSVLGLRDAEREIADTLEADGHRVMLPDLYDGARTDSYEEGFRLQQAIGEDTLALRARAAAATAVPEAVLAGVSFGAYLVGSVWSERPAAAGAVLLCGVAPWMVPRRAGLPVSVHIARPDPFDDEAFFAEWREAAGAVALDLHRYDGAGHYFLDRSLPDYDATAASCCLDRVRDFLAGPAVGRGAVS